MEELHVEEAVCVADRFEEPLRHIQRTLLHAGVQAAGVFPAHEGLGAGVHDRVDHAQHLRLAAPHPAVQVELRRGQRQQLFQHQAVGRASLRQALLQNALEGLDQAAYDPQFAPAEACVSLQFVAAVHLAGQHRERGLHRLDESRVGQAVRDVFAISHLQPPAGQVGLWRDALQHGAGMQLVLDGKN